jgi:hypothetical protein
MYHLIKPVLNTKLKVQPREYNYNFALLIINECSCLLFRGRTRWFMDISVIINIYVYNSSCN